MWISNLRLHDARVKTQIKKVSVRERTAFRLTCCSRRVNDGCKRVGMGMCAGHFKFGIGDI